LYHPIFMFKYRTIGALTAGGGYSRIALCHTAIESAVIEMIN